MKFLKKIIKVFNFERKKKYQEEKVEEIKLITEEREVLKEADKLELEGRIKQKLLLFPINSKVVMLKNIIKKLDNIEIKALSYDIKSYSLVISENSEFLFINLINKEFNCEIHIDAGLENNEQFLFYEKEYLIGRDKEIEMINSDFSENINYKISLIKYIKIKIISFLCLYYPEILKFPKFHIDQEGEKIITNIGQYIKCFLEGKNIKYDYNNELQKYFEMELNNKLFKEIYHDEDGNFYFEIKEENYFTSQYILEEQFNEKKNDYFKINFNEFISLKELNNLEFEELSLFKTYNGFDKGEKMRFYKSTKKGFVQMMINIQKEDIMII